MEKESKMYIENALNYFKKFGNTYFIGEILQSSTNKFLKELGEYLIGFNTSILCNIYINIYHYSTQIQNCLNQITSNEDKIEDINKYKIIVDYLKTGFVKKCEDSNLTLEIAKWCAEKYLFFQSLTIYREFIGRYLFSKLLFSYNNSEFSKEDKKIIEGGICNYFCSYDYECKELEHKKNNHYEKFKHKCKIKLPFCDEKCLKCPKTKKYRYNKNKNTINYKVIAIDWNNDIVIEPTANNILIKILRLYEKMRILRNKISHPNKQSEQRLNFDEYKNDIVDSITTTIDLATQNYKKVTDDLNPDFKSYIEKEISNIEYSFIDLNTGDVDIIKNADEFQIALEKTYKEKSNNDISRSVRSYWELEQYIKKYVTVNNIKKGESFNFLDFIYWLNNSENKMFNSNTLNLYSFDKNNELTLDEQINKMKNFKCEDEIVTYIK